MAITSPIIGMYQYQLGRRNLSQWGMIIVAVPFMGFYFNDFIQSDLTFMIIFMLMRVIQGIGTSMVQTSAYSILTLTYPKDINFVVGCIETAAGLGLSLGPVFGTILYNIGGVSLTFLTFFAICLIIGLLVKYQIPEEVDTVEDDDEEPVHISYFQLLWNKRIIFANICVFLAVFQYAFIDPLIANYLHRKFGIGYESSGYFFLALGAGYTFSCLLAHLTLEYVSNMRTCIVASILLGVGTMLYGDSNLIPIDSTLALVAVAFFFAGLANAHLVIPPMEEMLQVGQEMVSF